MCIFLEHYIFKQNIKKKQIKYFHLLINKNRFNQSTITLYTLEKESFSKCVKGICAAFE